MTYRTLEVTLISAKDLKDVNLFSEMDVYAVVSLSGVPRSSQRKPPDRDGGRNPAWNSTLRFNVPADNYGRQILHILLRAERSLGDRDVGEVRIPLSELLDVASGYGPKFVSYQVRKCTSSKPKGVLNLSYKVGSSSAGYPPYVAQPYPPPGGYPGYTRRRRRTGTRRRGTGTRTRRRGTDMGRRSLLGLASGARAALLFGHTIPVPDAGAYDAGYDAGFHDAGGFDF